MRVRACELKRGNVIQLGKVFYEVLKLELEPCYLTLVSEEGNNKRCKVNGNRTFEIFECIGKRELQRLNEEKKAENKAKKYREELESRKKGFQDSLYLVAVAFAQDNLLPSFQIIDRKEFKYNFSPAYSIVFESCFYSYTIEFKMVFNSDYSYANYYLVIGWEKDGDSCINPMGISYDGELRPELLNTAWKYQLALLGVKNLRERIA